MYSETSGGKDAQDQPFCPLLGILRVKDVFGTSHFVREVVLFQVILYRVYCREVQCPLFVIGGSTVRLHSISQFRRSMMRLSSVNFFPGLDRHHGGDVQRRGKGQRNAGSERTPLLPPPAHSEKEDSDTHCCLIL